MTMISRKNNSFFRNKENEINVPLEKFPLLTLFLLWLFAQLLTLQAFKAVADVFLENIYKCSKQFLLERLYGATSDLCQTRKQHGNC